MLLTVLLLVGWQTTPTYGQDREPSFAGALLRVSSIDAKGTWHGYLLIQYEPAPERGTGQVSVRVDSQTVMLDPSGEPAAFEHLQKGDSVAVWTNGIVLDSDPRQAYADTLFLIKTPNH